MLRLELVYLFEYYTNTSQPIIGREITQKIDFGDNQEYYCY